MKTWPALGEAAFRECQPHHQAGEGISVQQKGNVVGTSAMPEPVEPCQLKGFVQEISTPQKVSSATGAFQWDCWAGLAFPGCKLGFGRILLEKPFNV